MRLGKIPYVIHIIAHFSEKYKCIFLENRIVLIFLILF